MVSFRSGRIARAGRPQRVRVYVRVYVRLYTPSVLVWKDMSDPNCETLGENEARCQRRVPRSSAHRVRWTILGELRDHRSTRCSSLSGG